MKPTAKYESDTPPHTFYPPYMDILHRDSSIAQITPQQLCLLVSFLTYEQEPHVSFALTSVQARMKK